MMTIKALTLVSALALVLGASSAAMAQSTEPVEKFPMLSGALSRAQLTKALASHGYSNIKLSAEEATPDNPRPELHGHENLTPEQAAATPVHLGWNGTASKNGEPVDIYIVAEAPAKIPEHYGSTRDRGRLMVYLDHMQAGAHHEQSGSTTRQ